jgi:uncharacterized radical SAM superfamily Fe-S cluster-containing enzyme
MDKRIAIMLLNFIEHQNRENLAMKALLLTLNGNVNKAQMDSLIDEAMKNPEALDTVHAQWLPLRELIESESSLEEVLQQFGKIPPPAKGTN